MWRRRNNSTITIHQLLTLPKVCLYFRRDPRQLQAKIGNQALKISNKYSVHCPKRDANNCSDCGVNRIVCNIFIVVLSFLGCWRNESPKIHYNIGGGGRDDERKGYLQNSLASYKSSDVTVLVGRVGSTLQVLFIDQSLDAFLDHRNRRRETGAWLTDHLL